MPIRGLTTDREPAFPRIGVLRKGGVKPNEKQPGKDLTYFRFDSDDKQAVQDFEATYGKEPATINVYLAYPTPDENFQAWQEEYKAGGLVHRCDGETMTVWQTPDGKYSNEPKPCPYKGMARTSVGTFCKPVGRLTVIIPELRRFAYVTVGTTSKNDIMELTDNLNAVYAMRGTLQGIPFRLMRRPRMISTPKDGGGRARYEKWMLSIEADPAWVNVQIASMQRQAMIAPDVKMLTGGRTVQVDTGEIFDDEDEAPSITSLADVDAIPFDDEDEDIDDMEGFSSLSRADITGEWNSIPSQEAGKVNGQPVGKAKKERSTLDSNILRRFHAVGHTLYGDGWDDKRPELVKATTKGRSESSGDLTEGEADYLIGLMQKRINNGESVKAQPAETVPF